MNWKAEMKYSFFLRQRSGLVSTITDGSVFQRDILSRLVMYHIPPALPQGKDFKSGTSLPNQVR